MNNRIFSSILVILVMNSLILCLPALVIFGLDRGHKEIDILFVCFVLGGGFVLLPIARLKYRLLCAIGVPFKNLKKRQFGMCHISRRVRSKIKTFDMLSLLAIGIGVVYYYARDAVSLLDFVLMGTYVFYQAIAFALGPSQNYDRYY